MTNQTTAHSAKNHNLGDLPEWDLSALYASPQDAAFTADLTKCDKDASAFKQQWAGKLAASIAQPDGGKTLATAIKQYEAMSDLAGRIGSYAQLYYVGDTTDAERSKFYGDVQGKLNALSTNLLFFELELNRLDDEALNAALENAELATFKPWLDDLRKERPHHLMTNSKNFFTKNL